MNFSRKVKAKQCCLAQNDTISLVHYKVPITQRGH